jgi:hypothetical protein
VSEGFGAIARELPNVDPQWRQPFWYRFDLDERSGREVVAPTVGNDAPVCLVAVEVEGLQWQVSDFVDQGELRGFRNQIAFVTKPGRERGPVGKRSLLMPFERAAARKRFAPSDHILSARNLLLKRH